MSITGVALELVGMDGNAFSILGRAGRVLKDYDRENDTTLYKEHYEAYQEEATSGDYDNLLRVTMRYFECD